MKALVYGGPRERTWESVPDPTIEQPTDAVVRIDTTTICGTDLHILKGDVPAVTEGRILGHEAVGTVVETGAAVSSLKQGDHVLVPAITSCGHCSYCRAGMAAHCETLGGIGWIFGHLIDGVQSEYARVPFAETSVHPVPEGVSDETVAALGELSAAFEVLEEARGHLYAFHRRTGQADLELQQALDHLREAGHRELADEIDRVLVGRDVLPGMWTYQVVETYDRTYYDVWKAAVAKAERVIGAAPHLAESAMKVEEQSRPE